MSRKNVRFEDIDDDADERAGGLKSIFSNLRKTANSYTKWAKQHTKWALTWGMTIGWMMATSVLITALPLLLELQREQAVIELEKVQVKELLAQGYPPQELQRMGLTLEPSVLQGAAQGGAKA